MPRNLDRRVLFGMTVLVCGAAQLRAQCPDGTPLPCRVAPAARRAASPLDERTWIVLPFENVARAADIDWLREASVNLLYLDLSRWQDIRVIDDERVADLMREVPAATRSPIGLETGLAVARRAGAGQLVMGDLLKVGARTALVAKIYDVRTARRLRTVREEAPTADSLMPAFSRLARAILNVAPPGGAALGTIGTRSIQAYQEYVAGLHALNTWDLAEARQRFTRAIALDTTFALAHYKLSVVYGWDRPGAPERLRHAETAARFATDLPNRERTLIGAHLDQARGRWGEACETYAALIRGDSTDVEAWYNLGECSFHDPLVASVGEDTASVAFRGNWNTALRAFRRALELDPTYHLAFQHIQDILQAEQRRGCGPGATPEAACRQSPYTAVVGRQADSLVTTPISMLDAGLEFSHRLVETGRTTDRYVNLLLARDIAATWVAAGPGEPRARAAYGRALLRVGDVGGAAREFGSVDAARMLPNEQVQVASDRVEVALKSDRPEDAARLADSLHQAAVTVPQLRLPAALWSAIFGRFRRFEEGFAGVAPPPAVRFLGAVARLAAGLPPDSLDAIERGVVALLTMGAGARQPGVPRASDIVAATAVLGFRYRGAGSMVPLDTLHPDPRLRFGAVLVTGDTARARRSLAQFDSLLLSTAAEAVEGGGFFLSAESHALLGDSATALERLLEFERRWPYAAALQRLTPEGLFFSGMLWGRTWLLMGDLALAAGRQADAARAYRRVVGMWSGADPELQPTVERARAALARLGG